MIALTSKKQTCPVRIGIIGAGVFGNYHAKKIFHLANCTLTAVYDPHLDRAQKIASKYGAQVSPHIQALLLLCDALIIASPAHSHADIALQGLQAGKHCLVEKPLATRINSAQNLIQLAKAHNCILQVGFQERFILKTIGLDKIPETPVHIEAWRFSPPSQRNQDISTILDLMIHDLDTVFWLMGLPENIEGHHKTIRGPHADTAYAKLYYPGAHVQLHANRMSDTSIRQLHITYPSGRVQLDLNTQTLHHTLPFDLNENFAYMLKKRDALAQADAAFIKAIREGIPVTVSGKDGLNALNAALEIENL